MDIADQRAHTHDPATAPTADVGGVRPDALVEAVAKYLAMPDAGFFASLLAPDGTVVDVSSTTLDASGLTRGDVVGRPSWDTAWWNRSPHVQAWLRAGFEQALRGEPFRGESTYFRADGTQRIIECACTGIKDEAGRVIFVIQTGVDVTERRRAERESKAAEVRRESEARFGLMADSVPVMLWATGPDGEVTLLSRSWYEFTGCPAGAGLGRGWLSALHPRDRVMAEGALQRAVSRRDRFQLEYRLRRRDGSYRWALDVAAPWRDAAGEFLGFVGSVIDVTERRDAEDARRKSEERLRLATESARMFPFEVELTTGRVRTGANAAEVLGMPAPETVDDIRRSVHPDDLPRVVAQFEHALSIGDRYDAEFRFLATDGRWGWVSSHGTMARDGAGRPTRLVGITQNITARRAAEDALRDSEERLRRAQAVARLGSWDYGFESGEIRWSPEMFDLYGLPRHAQAPSRDDFVQLVHPADRDRTMAAIADAERRGGAYEIEFRAISADGRVVWISTTGFVELDAGGRAVLARGLDQDVTARKEAELALLDANVKKDNFIATLAHELRNPLAPIRNAVRLLRERGESDSDRDWCREIIERQVEQMVRLLEDLLDVARITSGKLWLRTERVELSTVIARAVETARPPIDEGGHELVIELPPEPVWLRGDETRLAQVFANLLTNAAKYTMAHGTIRLRADCHDGDVTVAVQDTGIGISAEHLPHVFEMFSQVERVLERSQGGLGIGLSLVRGLVEMHGGEVMAESQGVGRGSTFSVRLPTDAEPVMTGQGEAEAHEPPGPRRRILVVDDNHDGADSLALLLERLGNDVRTAYDGEQAVAVADEYRPEVVLLDVGMPKLNGYDVCRCIRGKAWGRDIVLVACTGWGQDEDRQRTQEAGFDHHLVKPVDLSVLQKVIARRSADERQGT